MNYHVLTLFPEMIEQAAHTSILGRALKNGCISLETWNIRDYSTNKHMRVDDYPYGGGAGMVIEAEPVYRAYSAVKDKIGRKPRTIYLTPQAKVLNQTMVEELALEKDLVMICGHYEGIDERVLDEIVTDYVSIGDYVLTGGELGAMVLIDAVSRFVPGVLSNEESAQFESLQDNLLEYPHYTRPEVWHEKEVPAILLSGDHNRIEQWRYERSIERTKERRPDLLQQSLQVHCACYGNEMIQEMADRLCQTLSRYGQVLNFNRKKLRKQKYYFDSHDLVVLLADKEYEDNAGIPEAFTNLYGKDTPCFLFVPETSIHDVGTDQAKRTDKLQRLLERRGFLMKRIYPLFSIENHCKETVLKIRKILE